MDEIKLNTIEWSTPEYAHKERDNDWFWTIGLITIVAFGFVIWMHNYIFAIFILLSGISLIMITMRNPEEVSFIVETKGLTMGRDFYSWKKIKSFNIIKKDSETYNKLLIETSKHFLPVYTLHLPKDITDNIKDELLKVIPRTEINESSSMLFMEKLGF